MPGNKNYVLQEAQKEIERLRKEVKRLQKEIEELRAGTTTNAARPVGAAEEKTAESRREGNVPGLVKGDYLYIVGLVKVLDQA